MDRILRGYKIVFSYVKHYPKFWLYLFLRALLSIADVSIPIIVGYLIILFTKHSDLNQIYLLVGILIAILIISPYLEKTTSVNAWFISFRIAHDFRRDTVKKLRNVGLSFWQTHERGNVQKIIDQSFEHLTYMTGMLAYAYIPFTSRVIGIIITSSFIDPIISIIFLVDAVFFFINLRIFVPKEADAGIKERKAQEDVYGRISEYLTNYKTVVYLNLFERQNKEIFQYNEAAYKAYKTREIFSGWKWYFNNQLHAICVAIIIAYSIWQVIQGHLEVGLLTTVIFFSMKISESLTELVWQLSELVKYSTSIQRYNDTFADVKLVDDLPERKMEFSQLDLKKVSMQQTDRETLRDVNLLIKAGEKIAVVGFTGSGKTTLIDIILKAISNYGGQVLINDVDYQDIRVNDIAKVYSIVPQEVQLFRGTLKDNILINSDADEHNLNKVIKVAALESLIEKLPEKLDSPIQEGAANISGGERQRIGIARALLQQHPVLILDEATASLDPKTERAVITNIINSYPGTAVLFVSHKYSLLNLFDHIIVMNEGSIIEQGSFKDLVKKGGLFKDLFDASQIQ